MARSSVWRLAISAALLALLLVQPVASTGSLHLGSASVSENVKSVSVDVASALSESVYVAITGGTANAAPFNGTDGTEWVLKAHAEGGNDICY